MTPEEKSLERIREIFNAASRFPEGPEREAFLDSNLQKDLVLRSEVASLLKASGASDGFLDRDACGIAFSEFHDLSGKRIGNFQLQERIGEGGFGEIYRADQMEPFQRQVALKIIKPGIGTPGMTERFKEERQALARMNHPNIAQVYDAGTTESGRPYFVMELVHGVPILAYCDGRMLPVRERVELFRQVCAGVQHAHKKGILHRDLKPSNILVSEEDGKPVPKIIDFGVAKSLQQRMIIQSNPTMNSTLIGTPLYMSPEQLAQDYTRLDERSDIYSLGIILYELVSGVTPLAHKTPTSMTIPEMRNALLHKQMPRPSRRFLTLGRKRIVISRRRACSPFILTQKLKGDLDRIISKAIELDPAHRYEDAVFFDDDLARYLSNQPVKAGNPRIPRRIKKFTRRHKPGCFAAASFLLTLIMGIVIMTVSFIILKDRFEHHRKEQPFGADESLEYATNLPPNAASQITP